MSGSGTAATLAVSCRDAGNGWACQVEVSDGPGRSTHEVTVSRSELERFNPAATDPTQLVERSFRFLLQREPRESILRRFAISEIERYFPEYAAEIRRG